MRRKLQIAKNHLLPKQMKEHGLKKGSLRIDEETLRAIIRDYTRESGVRQLERRLAAVCRKTDMQLLSKAVKRVTITEKDLPKLLDMQPYPPTVHVDAGGDRRGERPCVDGGRRRDPGSRGQRDGRLRQAGADR